MASGNSKEGIQKAIELFRKEMGREPKSISEVVKWYNSRNNEINRMVQNAVEKNPLPATEVQQAAQQFSVPSRYRTTFPDMQGGDGIFPTTTYAYQWNTPGYIGYLFNQTESNPQYASKFKQDLKRQQAELKDALQKGHEGRAKKAQQKIDFLQGRIRQLEEDNVKRLQFLARYEGFHPLFDPGLTEMAFDPNVKQVWKTPYGAIRGGTGYFGLVEELTGLKPSVLVDIPTPSGQYLDARPGYVDELDSLLNPEQKKKFQQRIISGLPPHVQEQIASGAKDPPTFKGTIMGLPPALNPELEKVRARAVYAGLPISAIGTSEKLPLQGTLEEQLMNRAQLGLVPTPPKLMPIYDVYVSPHLQDVNYPEFVEDSKGRQIRTGIPLENFLEEIDRSIREDAYNRPGTEEYPSTRVGRDTKKSGTFLTGSFVQENVLDPSGISLKDFLALPKEKRSQILSGHFQGSSSPTLYNMGYFAPRQELVSSTYPIIDAFRQRDLEGYEDFQAGRINIPSAIKREYRLNLPAPSERLSMIPQSAIHNQLRALGIDPGVPLATGKEVNLFADAYTPTEKMVMVPDLGPPEYQARKQAEQDYLTAQQQWEDTTARIASLYDFDNPKAFRGTIKQLKQLEEEAADALDREIMAQRQMYEIDQQQEDPRQLAASRGLPRVQPVVDTRTNSRTPTDELREHLERLVQMTRSGFITKEQLLQDPKVAAVVEQYKARTKPPSPDLRQRALALLKAKGLTHLAL